MNLTILLPSQELVRWNDVIRLVVSTSQGSWGLLPHRRDCVGVLVPGIVTMETRSQGVVFAAVDAGVMVKTGADIQISVRRALLGADLRLLRATVEHEYAALDQTARDARRVSEKLEAGLMRRLVMLHHE